MSRPKLLTIREQKFIDELLCTPGNATAAAKRAGYTGEYLTQTASQLLKKPKIIKELERRGKEICEQLRVTPERVLAEVASIAFQNPRQYVGIKQLDDVDPVAAKAIKTVKFSSTLFGSSMKEIECYDKMEALKLLADIQGMILRRGDDNTQGIDFSEVVAVMKEKDGGGGGGDNGTVKE